MQIDDFLKNEEKMYRDYPLLKKSLEVKHRMIERMQMNGAPNDITAISFDVATQGGGRGDTLQELTDFADALKEYKATKEAVEETEDILGELTEDSRNIINLVYFSSLTIEEVAEQLGVWSLSTVYGRKRKALTESAIIHHGSEFFDAAEK